jgi:hypothetical protein
MNILLLKPEMFVTCDGMMGLALFRNATYTWFFDGEDVPLRLFTKDVTSPSNAEILEELEENSTLLEYAEMHEAIEVQDRDDDDYLSYCTSYD